MALDEAGRQRALLPDFIRHQLPDKAGENDLSYIPIDEELASLSTAALMARYGLLKEIAGQLKSKLAGATPPS
jgi:hypothetical protein